MSLRIIKAGVLDTVQDLGRFGHQHLGINPGGAMDRFSAQVANILVGNEVNDGLIEFHFPASTILFEEEALIAISGADFSAAINGDEIPLEQPVLVSKNSLLQFRKWKKGARCYLAIHEKLGIELWLGSYSTNLKGACGGFGGRPLQKYDLLPTKTKKDYGRWLENMDFRVLPWKAESWAKEPKTGGLAVVPGNEWELLTEASKHGFLAESFTVGSLTDRMGCRVQTNLQMKGQVSMVSAPVAFGSIQLLPNGELVILMADHQTTGGYPRLGFIASAFLPALAQKQTGDEVRFELTSQEQATDFYFKQQQHLLQLQNACNFRMEEFFNGNGS